MVSTGIIEINAKCSDVVFKSCSSELYIDEKFVGYTPIQVFLPTGAYNYKLVKSGYQPPPPPPAPLTAGIMNVQYGIKYSLDVDLINSVKSGGLSIISTPDGANIFIDGQDRKIITPAIISNLTPGDHKYKLSLPGYVEVEGSFTMILGQTTYINTTFSQLKDYGTIYLYPTPFLYGRIIPYILEGAKIYIDNVDTGKLMSTSVTGLAKGVHTFRIERSGTIDRDGMFIINGGDTLLVSTYPILEPKTGMLVIRAAPFVGDPKIAKVYIDGKDTGKYANLRFALPEGTHTYKLQLEGYQDTEGKFDIIKNRITRITGYMNRLGSIPLGKVNISSDPPGALVAIDDIYLGQYTPTTVGKLFDGDYTYRLTRSGYSDATGTFTVTNGQTVDLNPKLIQNDTILDISANVIATMIYIDDHTEGWTTPAEIIGLSPGEHKYRLVTPDTYGDGFDDATGTFKIEANKTTIVNAELNIKKSGKGNLIVNSIPIEARVFIDDIDTKSITPDSIIGMEPGIHTVKLTLDGYKDWAGTVNIISGSIVSIFETLIPD